MPQKNLSNLTMKLFGLPYQFPSAVDPRVSTISSSIGKKYTENILLEAPVCTIIPGDPVYLPGKTSEQKISTSQALIEGHQGNFSALTQVFKDNSADNLRLYDFKNNYNDYIKYVNVLCRAGAVYLELDEKITVGKKTSNLQSFDWRNYKWNDNAVSSTTTKVKTTSKTLINKLKKTLVGGSEFVMDTDDRKEGSLSDLFKNYNYVQFFIDPDVTPSEALSNESGQSQLKSIFDSGSSVMKDIAFMSNSGGIPSDLLDTFTQESAAAMQAGVSSILGDTNISGALSRLINLSGNVLQGHNLVIPDIYQNSTYSKSYSITVHLKTPYGTKFGYYMDIFVPMMHLLALTMPKQESANSFSSPFLVKAYVDGIFSCNLGLVESISISKVSDSWSVSGLPTEVDVTLNITDLYSSLSMSPSSSPVMFANNSSLIEYIATNCGMSLTSPNFKTKWTNIINTVSSSFTDIPFSVKGRVEEEIYSTIAKMTSLYK